MQLPAFGMGKVQHLHAKPAPDDVTYEDSSVRPRKSGIVPARVETSAIELANVCAWLLAAARARPLLPRVVALPEPSTLMAFFGSGSMASPVRVFLFGGVRGRALLVAEWMKWEFPGVRVVGAAEAGDGSLVVEKANEACADVVVVGLGRDASNVWLAENASLLDCGLVLVAGDVLDTL